MSLYYHFKLLRKYLRYGFISACGRNFNGLICVRHKGGANKCKHYNVDFFRRINCFGYISRIQQTSLFTGYLGLIIYQNGLSNYILLSENLAVGDRIYCGTAIDPLKFKFGLVQGSSLSLFYMPIFSLVSNIELYPYKGGQLARAAGTSAIIVAKSDKDVSLN